MARPLRRIKGSSSDGNGVIKKSIRLFAFTAGSQSKPQKPSNPDGEILAGGQRLIENRHLPILYKERLAQ